MSEPDLEFGKIDNFTPQTAQNQSVLEFWNDLRGEAQVPQWSDFEPLEITDALRTSALLEFESSDEVKIRLYGNDLVDRLGKDMTGMNLLDLHRPEQLPRIQERIKLAQSTPAVLCSIVTAKSAMGVPVVAETMMFPFVDDKGTVARGLLSFGEMGEAPSDQKIDLSKLDGTNFLRTIVLEI